MQKWKETCGRRNSLNTAMLNYRLRPKRSPPLERWSPTGLGLVVGTSAREAIFQSLSVSLRTFRLFTAQVRPLRQVEVGRYQSVGNVFRKPSSSHLTLHPSSLSSCRARTRRIRTRIPMAVRDGCSPGEAR